MARKTARPNQTMQARIDARKRQSPERIPAPRGAPASVQGDGAASADREASGAHQDLPAQIAEAIRQAWPEGLIAGPDELDDARFAELSPRVAAALSRIPGATLLYQRGPRGGPRWDDGSNPDEDPPDWHDESRSYGVFFVSSTDERLTFATDIVGPEEDGVERHMSGEGRIGYVVAVSLVGPSAIVTPAEVETLEDGTQSEPDVEPHIFDLEGRTLDPTDHYRELIGDDGAGVLESLRHKIVQALEDLGVAIIAADDLERSVPWLRANEEVLVGLTGEPITVRDAFFYRGVA